MRRILVTGAGGFLGAELCRSLARENKVVAIVRRPVTSPVSSDIEYHNVGDISEVEDWTGVLGGVDTVVHLAARVHVMRESAEDPEREFRKVNVLTTVELARQAASAGVRRFIYISSIGVNGKETQNGAFTERDKVKPHSLYALSKYEAEEALWEIVHGSSMELVVIRPPLVYGANPSGNLLSLMRILKKRIPLPLASVKNERSLLALENLVDFMEVCIDHPNAKNELFLVADGEDVSTPELVRWLGEGMDKPAILLPFPVSLLKFGARVLGRANLQKQLCGSLRIDIAKARSRLNWQPRLGAKEALLRTGQSFREA